MKDFNQIRIEYRADSAVLFFAMPKGKCESFGVRTVVDVSRDNLPLGVEIFDASDIGAQRLTAVLTALARGKLKFSYDPDEDILLININAINENITTQRPGKLKFVVDGSELISLTVE